MRDVPLWGGSNHGFTEGVCPRCKTAAVLEEGAVWLCLKCQRPTAVCTCSTHQAYSSTTTTRSRVAFDSSEGLRAVPLLLQPFSGLLGLLPAVNPFEGCS